jgi:hypothetical protein
MAKGKKTGGRRAGTPNNATADARAAIALFVDGNAHRLQSWLDAIAEGQRNEEGEVVVPPNPLKAFELFQSVIEYHVPKLARTELTGKDGGPLQVNIVDPTRRGRDSTPA